MINENFIYFAALISFSGIVFYLKDTIKGKTKPNRVTWFFWALAPMIAFFSAIDENVGVLALTTFMVGFNPTLVFIASIFDKKAYWKLTMFDLACGFLALIGILLWQITGNGNLGITLAILADLFAAIPTIRKSYTNPETETYVAYIGGAIAMTITLLTINNWTYAYFAFPAYILSVNTLIVYIILFRRKQIHVSK